MLLSLVWKKQMEKTKKMEKNEEVEKIVTEESKTNPPHKKEEEIVKKKEGEVNGTKKKKEGEVNGTKKEPFLPFSDYVSQTLKREYPDGDNPALYYIDEYRESDYLLYLKYDWECNCNLDY